jgi:hypothetical protein
MTSVFSVTEAQRDVPDYPSGAEMCHHLKVVVAMFPHGREIKAQVCHSNQMFRESNEGNEHT